MQNPLLENFETPYQTVPFDKIKNEHFLPALKEAIKNAKEQIERIKNNPETPNFQNTIVALENTGMKVDLISSTFFNLIHAHTNDELQALAQELSPLLTAFSNDITLDAKLFEKVKTVYDNQTDETLNEEDKMLLERKYKGFVRNGANLSDEDKTTLRSVDKELAQLSLKFGENVLAETNSFVLIIEDEKDLEGLPETAIETAAVVAEQRGEHGKWVFTLQMPSYIPFMTYNKNRELRKKMYNAYAKRSNQNNAFDNKETVKKIVKLRHERAQLLGYKAHSYFKLEERMAKSPDTVNEFLNNLLVKAKPCAVKEVEEMQAYAKKLDSIEKLEKWDWAYYAEKLKMEKFSIDDQLLKPYLKLENTINGVFEVATKLFGIHFKENHEIPKYEKDVKVYEVFDKNNNLKALLYADFFARESKKQGAWMTLFQEQHKGQIPHISIVCNFGKPTETKPSLLTFSDLTTLFHEFGHALHGMLSNVTYGSLAGTNVYWDFVELPSQLMENWCYEKEALDLFAKHYETGESIPLEYIEKIKESANFLSGYQTVRQLSFGKLDMAWHGEIIKEIETLDVEAYEKEAMEETALFERTSGVCMSVAFSHLFQGGYSAGYYSYKWAEVLDADAFELFKEKGIFNNEVASAYLENILSKGGTIHPSTLYKQFRGRDAKVESLLKRAGLIKD